MQLTQIAVGSEWQTVLSVRGSLVNVVSDSFIGKRVTGECRVRAFQNHGVM